MFIFVPNLILSLQKQNFLNNAIVSGWDRDDIIVCGQKYEAVAVSGYRPNHYVTFLRGAQNEWLLVDDSSVSLASAAELAAALATYVILKKKDVPQIPYKIKVLCFTVCFYMSSSLPRGWDARAPRKKKIR